MLTGLQACPSGRLGWHAPVINMLGRSADHLASCIVGLLQHSSSGAKAFKLLLFAALRTVVSIRSGAHLQVQRTFHGSVQPCLGSFQLPCCALLVSKPYVCLEPG